MKDPENEQQIELKTFKEIIKMNKYDRLRYYSEIQNFCMNLKLKKQTFWWITKILAMLAPFTRNFEIEIRGEKNLPKDCSVVFMCNHSNSHDFFTIHEVFRKLKRNVTPLGACDGLGIAARIIFKLGDVTLIKRFDRHSKDAGILNFCHKILSGKDGFIFGEATWNLHPTLPMLPIKAGGTEVALITGKKLIPTIFEYVEVPHICKKEKELYSKVIVVFGEPYKVDASNNIYDETKKVQLMMENMRRALWKELGIHRESLDNIRQDVYLNHTYIKKFKAFGFKYNSKNEFKYLLRKDGTYVNEYYIDENGAFVPGITEK